MHRAIAMVAVLVAVLAGTAYGEDWVIDTVDHEGSSGGTGTFLWIDSNGREHIIYQDGYTVLHQYWSGTGWIKEWIADYIYQGAFKGCYDKQRGVVHVVSVTWAFGLHTLYRYLDGNGWHEETINTSQIGSLCVDAKGMPHFFVSQSHWYKDSATTEWKIDTLPFVDMGTIQSAAIAANGDIFIAYPTGNHLKLAHFDGSVWGTSYIDADDGVGNYCSLALSPDGVPSVVYYDATNTRLKYATLASPLPKPPTKVRQ